MNLAVVGTGYVGLVTGAVFADLGHHVWGLDIDAPKIAGLKKGKLSFFEPGLEELVSRALDQGRLRFTSEYQKAISEAEVIFVCVGTPTREDGQTDLSFVLTAAENLARFLQAEAVVVIKSTLPPSASRLIQKTIAANTKCSFSIAYCPEFLVEGQAVRDTRQPARVVIGTDDPKARSKLLELHQDMGGERIICKPESAQLIKYAANVFLGTKVSFANILAELCERYGADIDEVVDGLSADPRIGGGHLGAGLGVGGSCIPKDTASFSQWAGQEITQGMFEAVRKINDRQLNRGLEKVKKLIGSLKEKRIAMLGLAFKPSTDDLRQAPSKKLVKHFLAAGAKVSVFDPQAMENFKRGFPAVIYCKGPYETVKEADLLMLVTEWEEFRDLDWKRIKKLMKEPNIVDGRNFWDRPSLEKAGFRYEGFGR